MSTTTDLMPLQKTARLNQETWEGDVVLADTFASDGVALVPRDAVSEIDFKRLKSRKWNPRHSHNRTNDLWEDTVKTCDLPAAVIGQVPHHIQGRFAAVLEFGDSQRTGAAADRLVYLTRIAKADNYKTDSDGSTIVLYRGEQPVAVLAAYLVD